MVRLKHVTIATFDVGQQHVMAKLVAWESLIGWLACVNFVYQIVL